MSIETSRKITADLPIDVPENINLAVATLNELGNPQRLRILCHLANDGELSVGSLLERLDLSQSALSQHLARLRAQAIVATRKEQQTVFYRIARDDIHAILTLLHGLYCATGPDNRP